MVIGVATSAPGQSTAVALAGMVAVAAYATGPAIIISMLPMLAIAVCYQRLNLWDQNCGGPYVWVARAISPYVGYLVGWAMLVGFVLGSVSNILPLGPALLSFTGLDASGTVGNVTDGHRLRTGGDRHRRRRDQGDGAVPTGHRLDRVRWCSWSSASSPSGRSSSNTGPAPSTPA